MLLVTVENEACLQINQASSMLHSMTSLGPFQYGVLMQLA